MAINNKILYKEYIENKVEKERSFRSIRKEDLPILLKMAKENFNHYPEDQIDSVEYELNAAFETEWWGLPKFFTIDFKGKILGFGGYQLSGLDYDCFELYWININKEYRGKGVGEFMVNKIINEIKKEPNYTTATTILLSCQDKLKKFYNKFGFKTILKKSNNEGLLMGITINRKHIL